MSLFKNCLFRDYRETENKVSKERNLSFDLVRGLAVLFMIMVHVLEVYANEETSYSLFGMVIEFLGGPPAAPVFMFCMGVFYFLTSRDENLLKDMKRGVQLFLTGVILSFLREDLPTLIFDFDYAISGDYIFLFLWEVDILQFAGFSYILISLIKRFIRIPFIWLVISIIIAFISPYLWGITSGNIVLDWFLNLLWGNTDLVYFPLFSWLVFPLYGMIFGNFMRKAKDIDKLIKKSFYFAWIPFIIGLLIILTDIDYHLGTYYHNGPGFVIWTFGFILIWLSICNWLVKTIRENGIFNLLYYWSKNVTSFYFIHWILLSWGVLFLGYQIYGILGTIILMAIFIPLAHILTKFYINLRNRE